jgi:chromosome segregation ATPase
MNFASPEDADLIDVEEFQKPEEQTVTLHLSSDEEPTERSLPAAIEATAEQVVDLEEQLSTVETFVEERETAIDSLEETTADIETRLTSLTETVEETDAQVAQQETTLGTIQEKLNHLQEVVGRVESLESEVDRIDQNASETADRTADQDGSLCVLHTALFNEAYTCPSCEEGEISRNSHVTKTTVDCDTCEFSREISWP